MPGGSVSDLITDPLVPVPRLWGAGALFAFSGLDGPTDCASRMVASLGDRPGRWRFHLPEARSISIDCAGPGTLAVVTGDTVLLQTADGPLLLTWASWHTLVGLVPESADCSLTCDGPHEPAIHTTGPGRTVIISPDTAHGDCLVLRRSESAIAIAFGRGAEEARSRAEAGLTRDPLATARERLHSYSQLPEAGRYGPFQAKCWSVMRVNACSAEGPFPARWSTPDRIPHRHCWLWDSAFHAMALAPHDAVAAWEYLQAVLVNQHADGMVPHTIRIDGSSSSVTQPPILGWAVWDLFLASGDRGMLTWALPRLEAGLQWMLANRQAGLGRLLCWDIEDDPACRSGESGADNSPRFDAATTLACVDASVFAAVECSHIAGIAERLGHHETADRWRQIARGIRNDIHQHLWDDRAGIYVDARPDGTQSAVQAVQGFLPLLLPDTPMERVERLLTTLADEQRFGGAAPVPSVAYDHPSYSTDMWRGPTWINMNWFVVKGLHLHGRHDAAQRLAALTVDLVAAHWQRSGVVFEYYDSHDAVLPERMERKGPPRDAYEPMQKIDCIRDYHWTAACSMLLIADR